MKKFLLMLFVMFMMTASASAYQFVSLANGVGGAKFLQNWGYASAWNGRQSTEGPPICQNYFVYIPAAQSGLGDLGYNKSGYGVADISLIPSTGEVAGIRLMFNGSSPNPKGTLADALSAAIGRNNFNADKSKFNNAVSKILNGQEKYATYYSESMQRSYMITIKPMEQGFYKLAVYAFTN